MNTQQREQAVNDPTRRHIMGHVISGDAEVTRIFKTMPSADVIIPSGFDTDHPKPIFRCDFFAKS